MFNIWGRFTFDITKITSKKSRFFEFLHVQGYWVFFVLLFKYPLNILRSCTVRMLWTPKHWFLDIFACYFILSTPKMHTFCCSLCDHHALKITQDIYKMSNKTVLNAFLLPKNHFKSHACLWYIPLKNGFIVCQNNQILWRCHYLSEGRRGFSNFKSESSGKLAANDPKNI